MLSRVVHAVSERGGAGEADAMIADAAAPERHKQQQLRQQQHCDDGGMCHDVTAMFPYLLQTPRFCNQAPSLAVPEALVDGGAQLPSCVRPHTDDPLCVESLRELRCFGYGWMVNAQCAVTPNDLDIVAKFLYARTRSLALPTRFVSALYVDHLLAVNGLCEGNPEERRLRREAAERAAAARDGGPAGDAATVAGLADGTACWKNSTDDFLDAFDDVLRTVDTHGFRVERAVPLDLAGLVMALGTKRPLHTGPVLDFPRASEYASLPTSLAFFQVNYGRKASCCCSAGVGQTAVRSCSQRLAKMLDEGMELWLSQRAQDVPCAGKLFVFFSQLARRGVSP